MRRLLKGNGDNFFRMNSNHTIYKGKRLVLSAGTWSKELLAKLGLNLPATRIRKAFAWFKAGEKLSALYYFINCK
ncbi:hypothetical protein SAMN05880580_11970 [Priestia flexa]|nr:hypothetical protein SAMN05880580_11970 [Priestia flexa]